MSSGGGSSTTQVKYSPTEQAARDDIAAGARGLFEQLWKAPVNNDTIARPVNPSSGTQYGWQLDNQAVQAMMGGTQRAQSNNNWVAGQGATYSGANTQGQIDNSNRQLLTASNVGSNPIVQNAIKSAQQPLVDQFQNAGGVLSNIRNNAVANGNMGGSRQGIAEGLAMQGLQRSLGDVSTNIMSKAYDSGLQAQTAATNNLMGAQNDALKLTSDSIKNQAMLNMMYAQPGEMMAQNGAQQEAFAQNWNNYNAEVAGNWENQRMRQLQNFANMIYGNSNGTTVTKGPKQDNTAQYLGTAATTAMMAMMMFSDERLKSNIVKIGEHIKGFGIYLYKIFDRLQCGVLAQEVEKVMPEAVLTLPSGLKMVNYDMIIAEAK